MNAVLRESLDFPEEYMEPAYRHGVALYEHGRFAEAEQVFLFLAACDCTNPTLWKALGSAHKMTGKHDEAVAAFGMAVSAGANDPWIPVHAAECLMHMQRFREALAALRHATLSSSVAGPEAPALRRRVGALLQGVENAVAAA
jgi:type III secretion system low calcium response chaperone LcrH/SycD